MEQHFERVEVELEWTFSKTAKYGKHSFILHFICIQEECIEPPLCIRGLGFPRPRPFLIFCKASLLLLNAAPLGFRRTVQ